MNQPSDKVETHFYCSNLNRRRYAQNDDTLYVAPEDVRTDYVRFTFTVSIHVLTFLSSHNHQWQIGIVVYSSEFFAPFRLGQVFILHSTGKRRYGHPALNGVLPQPWLPLKKGQSLVNHARVNGNKGGDSDQALVLTLRKRRSMAPHSARPTSAPVARGNGNGASREPPSDDNPWDDAAGPSTHRLNHRLSFDHASGVIMLPDDDWLGDDSDSDEEYTPLSPNGVDINEALITDVLDIPVQNSPSTVSPSKQRYGTYYHHPEKRRQTIPGAFPRS